MAPTICSGKKPQSRTLNNDIKRGTGHSTAIIHRIPKHHETVIRHSSFSNFLVGVNGFTHARTAIKNTFSDTSVPLNLACNKTSKQLCTEANIPDKSKTFTSNHDKNLLITDNARFSERECVTDANPSVTMPSAMDHFVRRLSNASQSDFRSSDSEDDDDDDDDDDFDYFKDDNDDYSADDYQENVQIIDEKKRLLYNTIISGNFSENDGNSSKVNNKSDKSVCHSPKAATKGAGQDIELNKSYDVLSPSDKCSTEGLLSIAIKTVKLVKRNQLLQQRLNQLQVETSAFIESVLNNPENRHFREKVQEKVDEIKNT